MTASRPVRLVRRALRPARALATRTKLRIRPLRPPTVDARRVASLSLTSDDSSFITGNGLASRCRYVLNYDVLQVNEAGEEGWWFVKTDFLDFFFRRLAPKDDFVLFTHNSDYPIDERYRGRLQRRGLVAWFGVNVALRHPKLFPFPLGIGNPRWPHGDVAALHRAQNAGRPRTELFNVSFDPMTNPREREYCLAQTGLSPAPKQAFPDYVEDLASSYFCIAPRGNGEDTHRTWEALYLRTIPVVTRSLLTERHPDLPLIVLDDWADFRSVDFSPELYRRVLGDWDPRELALDPYLDRVRTTIATLARS